MESTGFEDEVQGALLGDLDDEDGTSDDGDMEEESGDGEEES